MKIQKSLDDLQIGTVFRFAVVRPKRKHPLVGQILVVLKRAAAACGRAAYIVVGTIEDGVYAHKPAEELPHPYHTYKIPLESGMLDGYEQGTEPKPLELREYFPLGKINLRRCTELYEQDVIYLRDHAWVCIERIRKMAIPNKRGTMLILGMPIGPDGVIPENPPVKEIAIPYDDLLSSPDIQIAEPLSSRATQARLPKALR